jgi:ATP-binding cassette subfamily C protein
MLRFYGRVVPLAELREACGVSRDGSKASNVVRAATRYGLEARGLSCGLEALREIPCPYIVFWKFGHFVVVEGFDRHWVYMNDPATGHRRVTRAEFDDGFTGVVLTMKPGPEFERGGRSPSALSSLIGRLRGHGATLLFCLLVGLLLVLPGLALPACAAAFVDSVVIDGRSGWLRPLLLIMAAALLLQFVLKLLHCIICGSTGIALAARLSGRSCGICCRCRRPLRSAISPARSPAAIN